MVKVLAAPDNELVACSGWWTCSECGRQRAHDVVDVSSGEPALCWVTLRRATKLATAVNTATTGAGREAAVEKVCACACVFRSQRMAGD